MLDASAISRFDIREVQPFGGRYEINEYFIGGIFAVHIVFVIDPANEYRQLEYRQYIRGQTLLNGNPVPSIMVPLRGALVSIHPQNWMEDGDSSLGSNAYYGRRSNTPVANDRYLSGAGGREAVDMQGGNIYRNFDRYGFHITQVMYGGALVDLPQVPFSYAAPLPLRYGGANLTLNLEFKGHVVDRGPDGSGDRILMERRWRKGGMHRVPFFASH